MSDYQIANDDYLTQVANAGKKLAAEVTASRVSSGSQERSEQVGWMGESTDLSKEPIPGKLKPGRGYGGVGHSQECENKGPVLTYEVTTGTYDAPTVEKYICDNCLQEITEVEDMPTLKERLGW